ncbi:Peptidase inhibitor 16 [Desmophyllum pertusum]|uniref:Peptidase inhibitor 16 n=1 Tax=Desmophyllum pertusum TaxID=174260 RepID=A0A9W9YU22_9CNID|nr:Peptidase inhibitor 16 [Desmophyllum pertusum]
MVTYTDFTSSFPLHDIFMIFFSEAPETGPHVFYMTCQDECELWWSPGDTPDNRKRIILVPFGVILDVKANEWEKSATQISSPVHLCSGEFYFMQAVMKAGKNPYDHLSVGVRQPSGQKHRPILNVDLFYEIPEKRSASFLLVQKDTSLVGHVMNSLTVSNMECSLYCARDKTCQSYNYYNEPGICELNSETRANNAERLVPSIAADYYEKLQP